jgi:hypothetical protein
MCNVVCIYQTEETIGYATRPLWQKICETTNAIRLLFIELDDKTLDGIDELYMVNELECIKMLDRSLTNNPNTRYMS